MEAVLLLCAVPVLWPFAAKLIWGRELTLAELGLNAAIGIIVAVGGWAIGHYVAMADEQVLNGQVVSKERKQVSCEHSYSCNCREVCSGSGSGRSCSTHCDTCHEHVSDFDWVLHSDIGRSVKINRINRRGDVVPDRFMVARAGDPFSISESYVNYIKAAPHSLFNFTTDLQRYAQDIPPYPLNIFDYHYLSRVVTTNLTSPLSELEKLRWNTLLAEKLKTLGPLKKVNAVVVISGHDDSSFAEAVRQSWLGGKKNDVVVVIGAPNYPEISWVHVYSWSDAEVFKVGLRDALLDLKTADPQRVVDTLGEHVERGYVGKPMKDFEYLEYEIELSWTAWLLLALSSLGVSILTSFFLARNSCREASSFN